MRSKIQISSLLQGNIGVVAITFLIQGLNAFLSFGLQIFISNNVSVDTYGSFGILINYINLATFIILCGVNTYMLRKMSTLSVNQESIFIGLYKNALLFIISNWLVLSTLIFIILILGSLFYHIPTYYLSPSIWFLALAMCVSTLLQYIDRAMGFPVRSMLGGSLIKNIAILCCLFTFLIVFAKIKLETLMISYLLGYIIVVLFYVILHRKKYSFKLICNEYKKSYLRTFKNSKDYFINRITQNTIKSLDLILIGLFLTTYDAGIYSATMKINLIIIFGLSAINIVYSSDIARLYKQSKIKEINNLLFNANILIFGFGVSIFLAVLLFGKYILSFFGEEYISAVNILYVISLGSVIESFFGVTGVILNMTGNQKYFNKILFFVLFLVLIVGSLILNYYGLIEFAFFLLFMIFFKNALQWRFIHKQLHINTGVASLIYNKIVK